MLSLSEALFSKKNINNNFNGVKEILQNRKFYNKYKFFQKYNSEIVELGRDIIFNEFDKLDDFYISIFNLNSLCKWIEDQLPSSIYKKSRIYISIEYIKDFCINLSEAIRIEFA